MISSLTKLLILSIIVPNSLVFCAKSSSYWNFLLREDVAKQNLRYMLSSYLGVKPQSDDILALATQIFSVDLEKLIRYK